MAKREAKDIPFKSEMQGDRYVYVFNSNHDAREYFELLKHAVICRVIGNILEF